MGAEVLVLLAFPALLALAAGCDIASYTIPNAVPIAIIAVFAAFVPLAGLSAGAFGWHLAAGVVGLTASFGLFAAGYIGGGDAKLFAACALWFGFPDLLTYTLIAALLGGGLSLLILSARRLPLPAGLLRYAWIARLHDAQSGIPYGVALAAGALLQLPQAEVFRMVGLA